jgi:hypothetical protein
MRVACCSGTTAIITFLVYFRDDAEQQIFEVVGVTKLWDEELGNGVSAN